MVSDTTTAADDPVSVADMIADLETQVEPQKAVLPPASQTAPAPLLRHGASMLTAAASFEDVSKVAGIAQACTGWCCLPCLEPSILHDGYI